MEKIRDISVDKIDKNFYRWSLVSLWQAHKYKSFSQCGIISKGELVKFLYLVPGSNLRDFDSPKSESHGWDFSCSGNPVAVTIKNGIFHHSLPSLYSVVQTSLWVNGWPHGYVLIYVHSVDHAEQPYVFLFSMGFSL